MEKFLQYSSFILVFYTIAFIFFILRFFWRVFTIRRLTNEAYGILKKLSDANPPTKNVEYGMLTFQSNMTWNNPTPELRTIRRKYEKWCYQLKRIKAHRDVHYIQDFGSMADSLFKFINLSSEYCWDEWSSIFKKTFLAPSTILEYIGMPINFMSRALDVLLGFPTLIATISKIWFFITALLQNSPPK